MAKEYAKAFYKSKAWISCRKSYIANRIMIDGGLCEICHDDVGYIIHHKTELTPMNINNTDITLNHCNLQYVCHRCHDDIHYNKFHGTTQPVKFDCNGNIIPERE
jgi:5-methylcytosine-specific restriction enzyme A